MNTETCWRIAKIHGTGEQWRKLFQAARDEDGWRLVYHNYLQSTAWLDKAEHREILDHHQCSRCGGTFVLQIHHKHYRTVGNESMEDLETLCRACHALHHGKPSMLPETGTKHIREVIAGMMIETLNQNPSISHTN